MSSVSLNHPIVELNFLKLGGTVSAFVEADNITALSTALDFAWHEKLKVLPVGEGSNLVLGDTLDYLLLRYTRQGYRVIGENESSISLRIAAGTNWHAFVQECLAKGWYGLENLALIPGTVGAAPIQNIGAYGVEVAEFIDAIHGNYLPFPETERKSAQLRLDKPECQFGYRDSVFKRGLKDKVLITAVDITLRKHFSPRLEYPALQAYLDKDCSASSDNLDAKTLFNAVIALRESKLPDPAELPNVGSFFKNPTVTQSVFESLSRDFPQLPSFTFADDRIKIPAAWLIEKAGFKGDRRGAIGMHDKQALVLVNYGPVGEVRATEVLDYAAAIVERVSSRFGIALEIEPAVYT